MDSLNPVLPSPADPPEDVWANALSGALRDPRSPEDFADLLPGPSGEPGGDYLADAAGADDGDDEAGEAPDEEAADADDAAAGDEHPLDSWLAGGYPEPWDADLPHEQAWDPGHGLHGPGLDGPDAG